VAAVARLGHQIALLGAGIAGQAAELLHSVEVLPGWSGKLRHTSFIIRDDSMVGRSPPPETAGSDGRHARPRCRS
jgi:hypothetical protein